MKSSDRDVRFRLHSRYRRWLDECACYSDEEDDDSKLAAWVLRKMSRRSIIDVGGVLVDKAVLKARFSCVPQRCSPATRSAHARSCCADLAVILSATETGRLRRYRAALRHYLQQREPHLGIETFANELFFIEEEGNALCRPRGRCLMSKIDKTGRIRCHLHGFAQTKRLPLHSVQPLSCGLFPLALLVLPSGRVLLTVLEASNHKLLGSLPPRRFPCLCDDSLPPLVDSMAATMDLVLGKGFSKALRSHID